MRKTILATLIILAVTLLVTAALAAARSTKHPDKNIHAVSASSQPSAINNRSIDPVKHPDKNIHAVSASSQPSAINNRSIDPVTNFEMHEDTAALTTAAEEFRPRKVLTASAPNFSTPLRRAPLRRKGHIQG